MGNWWEHVSTCPDIGLDSWLTIRKAKPLPIPVSASHTHHCKAARRVTTHTRIQFSLITLWRLVFSLLSQASWQHHRWVQILRRRQTELRRPCFHCTKMSKCLLRRVWLFVTPWIRPTRLLCPWSFPGKNTGVGRYFLLQGIFLTQGLNPRLLSLLQIL